MPARFLFYYYYYNYNYCKPIQYIITIVTYLSVVLVSQSAQRRGFGARSSISQPRA